MNAVDVPGASADLIHMVAAILEANRKTGPDNIPGTDIKIVDICPRTVASSPVAAVGDDVALTIEISADKWDNRTTCLSLSP